MCPEGPGREAVLEVEDTESRRSIAVQEPCYLGGLWELRLSGCAWGEHTADLMQLLRG